MRALLALLLAMVAALCAGPALAAPEFPKLTGRVVDAANIIPPDEEARLDSKLAALEAESQRQLVVATLPSLQGYEISDYGYQLGRAWGLGDEQRNDGAILIVAPNERKLRIEVGYGLEPIVTDGFSSDVINQIIVPRFKADDLPGGIEAGTDALITQLQLPPDEAAQVAAEADRAATANASGGVDIMAVLPILIFVFFFFILPMLRGRSRGGSRRRSRMGPVVWIPGGFGSSGGGGWSGGGGGFGGGGFSGGGGSFGGGGASGSW
ncbi:TPM domain-containing protein [Novosphingobium aquimarinum]|uniref:TPM domain-containing protein n=1 Tax=Novosphingobium aquimarinum TaxID=2682494 RepID=UPI0012EB368D|nr:TPM domain-containing protein [Novosphingobium aquimarinum]